MSIVTQLTERAKIIYEVDITKDDAQRLLKLPGAGRPLNPVMVETYKLAINALPESSEAALRLILTKAGKSHYIADGRHRLAAFYESNLERWKLHIELI